MADLHELIAHLDELLRPGDFRDMGPNGLQVEGSRQVSRVVTAVSAQRELFERAADLGAQLVLVHHGLFWDFHPVALERRRIERLRVLLAHDLSLAAYHLPLDAHREVGNNALLAEALGLRDLRPFGQHGARALGWAGRFPGEGITPAELVARVTEVCGRAPLLQGNGPDPVRTLGIVSGSAAGDLDEAIADGLDAFMTGEPKEHVMADAREAGVHFLAAGHYATETHGVRALGDRLAARFGVEHVFVDIPNPV